MKQTAVEWLVEQLRQLAHNPNTHIGMGDIRVTQGHLDQLEEQSKAIEEEQIIKAYKRESCYMKHAGCTDEQINQSAEQYYNETFKSE